MRRARLGTLLLAATGLVVAAGCGGDSSDLGTETATGSQEPQEESAPTTTTTPPTTEADPFCDGAKAFLGSDFQQHPENYIDENFNPMTDAIPMEVFDAAAALQPPPEIADAWVFMIESNRRHVTMSAEELLDAAATADPAARETALRVRSYLEGTCGMEFDPVTDAYIPE